MNDTIQSEVEKTNPPVKNQGEGMTFTLAEDGTDNAQLKEPSSIIADKEGKYLTFTLNTEEYGIGILKIKEIIGMMPITSVPRTPTFVKGVINLRGKVIPVIDLRLRFDMETIEYTDRTCIIVVEVGGQAMHVTIGLVVDSVSEVLNFKQDDIENTPSFGTQLDTRYILGMAKMDGKVKILLDINEVLDTAQLAALTQAV